MKRLLVVTYYWPPSGGVGVSRWLKMTKYLARMGHQITVITPANPSFELRDESLEKDVHSSIKVIRRKIWEPLEIFHFLSGGKNRGKVKQGLVLEDGKKSRVKKLFIWIRGNLFIPDPKIFWVKPTAAFITKYLKKNPHDVIITTGPPHSMHLIGSKVKQKTGIRWIADFRDPWSDWDVLENLMVSATAIRRHKKFERKVLQKADIVTTVSPSWQEMLSEKISQKKVELIYNGYDEEDFDRSARQKPDRFLLCHYGILNQLRNPIPFFDAVSQLIDEVPELGDYLFIDLAGPVGESYIQYLNQHPQLSDKYVYTNYIPYEETIRRLQDAALPLVFLNQRENRSGNIPVKFFDYLGLNCKMLVLGSSESSDLAEIVRKYNLGYYSDIHDIEQVKAMVRLAFNEFLAAGDEVKENKEEVSASTFTRRAQAEKFHILAVK